MRRKQGRENEGKEKYEVADSAQKWNWPANKVISMGRKVSKSESIPASGRKRRNGRENQKPRAKRKMLLSRRIMLFENRLQIGNSEIELISRNFGRRRLLSGWILLRCQIYFTLSLSDLAQISDDFRDGVREEGTQKAGENVKLKDMRQIH